MRNASLVPGLIVSGLITGLLALAGAALIEASPAIGKVPPGSCTAFQVGSPHAANTHIHLENVGPDAINVRFEFVDDGGLNPRGNLLPIYRVPDHRGELDDDSGLNPQGNYYDRSLAPWAADEVVFRTPALGSAVKLNSSGVNLYASTEIRRDHGTPPEIRKAVLCLAQPVLWQAMGVS